MSDINGQSEQSQAPEEWYVRVAMDPKTGEVLGVQINCPNIATAYGMIEVAKDAIRSQAIRRAQQAAASEAMARERVNRIMIPS